MARDRAAWGRYVRARYLFWRIRIPLWLMLAGAGWALASAADAVGGALAACVVEGVLSYRRQTDAGPASRPRRRRPRGRKHSGSSCAGGRTRFRPREAGGRRQDRGRGGSERRRTGWFSAWTGVPAWVRLWHKTPFSTGTRIPGCGSTADGTRSRPIRSVHNARYGVIRPQSTGTAVNAITDLAPRPRPVILTLRD